MPSAMSDPATVAQDHHATLSLLQAMYPMPGELVLTPRAERFLADPTTYNAAGETLDSELNITSPDAPEDDSLSYSIVLTIPSNDDATGTELPRCSVYLRQPPSLTRAEHAEVLQRIPPHTSDIMDDGEYILDILHSIPTVVQEVIAARPIAESSAQGAGKVEPLDDGPLERVWFWFPTLSSKEKRRDIVEYAEEAGLTGFVLAGTSCRYDLEVIAKGGIVWPDKGERWLMCRQTCTAVRRRRRSSGRSVHGQDQE